MQLLAALAVIGAVSCAPLQQDKERQDVRLLYHHKNRSEDNINYAFALSDGTRRRENINIINNENTNVNSLVIRGYYTWVAPDHVRYTVTYYADETGFHPKVIMNSEKEFDKENHGSIFISGIPAAVYASLLGG